MPPDGSVCNYAPERPRNLRICKKGRPRKEYGQVSIITVCFEASPSVREAVVGPNKTAWKNIVKEEHDALIIENAWTLVLRPKHKKNLYRCMITGGRYQHEQPILEEIMYCCSLKSLL
ncbi:hypothetical protein NPIL_367521 [Nephila pilipes]|uniref:Uncharacterized protein n=1 Tax=Nephila pilipes TaxID=299642 RepID=A0A8X6Q0Q6_NEPPI|nr:hypothetical protein NPIL_367521 [Nephila pilipes]